MRRRVWMGRTGKLRVAAFKEYQWAAAIDGVIMQGCYAPHENFVVAAVKPRVSLTFENNRRVWKHWDPGLTCQRRNAVPFIAGGTRKLVGNLLLLFVEHIDGIAFDRLPNGEAACPAKHAEQDQRRVQGNRVERTHGSGAEIRRSG